MPGRRRRDRGRAWMERRRDLYRSSRRSCVPQTQTGPLQFLDLGCRDLLLALVAPAKEQDRRGGANEAEDRHPPDVPDEGEADDDRKEGCDEPNGAVAWHLNGLIVSFDRAHAPALHVPEGVD